MEHLRLLGIEPWWVQAMGLFEDGTVRKISLTTTDQRYCYTYEIEEDLGWRNVKDISSSRSHLAGLAQDGKVLIEAGDSYHFQGVESWANVIRVMAGYEITAGILEDKTLLYTYNGNNESFEVKNRNIRDIALSGRTVYGIDEKGTLFQFEHGETSILNRNSGQVIQLGVVGRTIYGLTTEGNVKVLYGTDCDQKNWSNVIQLASGNNHILGLTDSGRVLWKGEKSDQVEALNPDSKIIHIFAGCYHSLAMNEEGNLFSPEDYWHRY